MKLSNLLPLLFAPLLLLACVIEVPKDEEQTPNGKLTVSGRLVQGADLLQAATGRELKLVGAGTLTALTDTEGSFVFSGVTAGAYELHSSIPSTTSSQADYAVMITHVVVDSNALDLGSVALPGAVSGKVTLQGAADHTGADIFVPGTSWIAKSDADGNFVLVGLPNGSYTLRFSKEGFNDAQIDEVPAVSGEINAIDPIELTTDESSGAVLAGKVILSGRGDSLGVTVTLEGSDKTTMTAADGSFQMTGIAAGSYTVAFSAPDGWVSDLVLPNLPLMPGNPVTLPDLTFGRGDVLYKGFVQTIADDGSFAAVCDANDSVFILNLETKALTPLNLWCFDSKFSFGDTVAFAEDSFVGSILRYDLATWTETTLLPGDGFGSRQYISRGDTLVLRKGGWVENEWEETYMKAGATGSATLLKQVVDWYPSGLHYMSPFEDKVLVATGTRYENEFPVANTYAAMSIADGTLQEIGELSDFYFGEDDEGIYFVDGSHSQIVYLDFATWTTTTAIANIPALNSGHFIEHDPNPDPYPLAYTAATDRLAFLADDGLYAATVSSGVTYQVLAFDTPVVCDGDTFCQVSFLPGGDSVVASWGLESYQGSVTAPAAPANPASISLVGTTPAGALAFFDASGLKVRAAGASEASLVAEEVYYEASVKGNHLFYYQTVQVELTSPVYSHYANHLVAYPMPSDNR